MINMNKEKEIELIKDLSLAFGPSGCEDRVREKIGEYTKELADKCVVDRLGNLICKMSFGNADAAERRRIMLSAHMDEVGMMIDSITSDGMLTFGLVGGIDSGVIAGRKVLVGNEKELLQGVICSKAVHHKDKEERKKAVDADKLYIDIGFNSKEEAEKHIAIGDFATFDSEFYLFGKDDNTIRSKALDDRMGCAALIEVMRELAISPIDDNLDVYFCFTVREEIGSSGASAAAVSIVPDLAVVLETTAISDIVGTPDFRRVADVGNGVVVSVADRTTIYRRDIVNGAMSIAEKCGVAAQIKRYVAGGNDAGKIHKALAGVPVLTLSVPTRYLHSPACVAELCDYRAQRELVYSILKHNKEII